MKPSVLVTAGPTREKIDPVRFISNYSTGAFGYEIASLAARRGFKTTLVSGPTALQRPKGVRFIGVESAEELRKAVSGEFKKHDLIIMAAAVSDWRVKKPAGRKLKRLGGKVVLVLDENPDILGEIGEKKGGRVLVGFALETENLERNALKKLMKKNVDIIIGNRLIRGRDAFGGGLKDILIIDRYGNKAAFRRKTKKELAKIILDKALAINI